MKRPFAEAQLSGQFFDKMDAEIAAMRAAEIHAHWQDLAVRYGTDLRATTIASSIKRLEIAALHRAIGRVAPLDSHASILEIGCGNGQNIVALAKIFQDRPFSWTGIDYVPEMVDSARRNADFAGLSGCANFLCKDIREVRDLRGYNIVFTDRMLINLSSIDEQIAAIEALKDRLIDGGTLILIENSRQTKDAQNDLRAAMGLPRRKDADFNLFFDDRVIVPHLKSLFSTVEIEDFGSLHDILLYVLLPQAMGAEFQYEHPLMEAVANLCTQIPIGCGAFGQNRLYLCR
jgi:SAM-dependent methyltransferase